MFYDNFTTVPSRNENLDSPPWWNVIDLGENSVRIPLDNGDFPLVDKDWLSTEELEERLRHDIRQKQLRQAYIIKVTEKLDSLPLLPVPPSVAPSPALSTPIVPHYLLM